MNKYAEKNYNDLINLTKNKEDDFFFKDFTLEDKVYRIFNHFNKIFG